MNNDDPMAEVVEAHTLRFIRRYDSSPERVWRALTDVDELRAWTGMDLLVEPRVGGRVVSPPGRGWVFDFDPPRLLRFSNADLSVPAAAEAARRVWTISWELIPDDGGTRLVFIHRFLRGDHLYGLGAGWHGFLDQLRSYLDRDERAALLVGEDTAPPDDDLRTYRRHVAAQLRSAARRDGSTEVRDAAEALYYLAIQDSVIPDYSVDSFWMHPEMQRLIPVTDLLCSERSGTERIGDL